ncbi:hypothetical protein N3K63_04155 [Microbacterium sp. W1N]|uniref:hypothetical protein n=1 Tax=Microbacterium festucae TaxID=2977531 RepID=UPI0021C15369|nr:hypothetical protein [Microbacterium festucae]MCT9819475.1 hypothetical protein [Microbacterium festucae]
MNPAAPARLDVSFPPATENAAMLVVAALRDFRVDGNVHVDDEARRGWVRVDVSYAPERGIIVADRAGIRAPTPAPPLLEALAARLGATVSLWSDDAFFAAGDDRDTATGEESSPAARGANEIHIVYGTVPLAPDRRGELALQLGGDLTAVPTARGVVIVADASAPGAHWPKAQRPVLTLTVDADVLQLAFYGASSVAALPLRERLAAAATPDLVLRWEPAPVPTLPELIPAPPAPAAADDSFDLTPLEEIQVDHAALRALIDAPLDAEVRTRVLTALRLDPPADQIARGEVDPGALPGAVRIVKKGLWGTIADAVAAEPEGTSLWARWRRLPHRRPRLARLLTALEAVAAVAVCVAAALPPFPQPLTTVQWVMGAVLVVDVITDVVVLRAAASARAKGNP